MGYAEVVKLQRALQAEALAKQLAATHGIEGAAQHIIQQLGDDHLPVGQKDELVLAADEVVKLNPISRPSLLQAITDHRIKRGNNQLAR